ncbi:hypothetical protein H2201_005413 [Coniosporium apollinis]|uniref:Spo12-like protein n=2 Tax=Coniosporium TaxID=2810619 RepID=A0ABQ9NPY1_9PEZI|nr:hypothetical protein H2199_004351 [Cladosporium sp. JES 115]KAJ9663931.1 hypothetical protein H2201_005413 [Coniosporium apollinis]
MSSNVLSARDTSTQPAPKSEDQKPMSMEYHRQVLESRLKDGQNQQTYVSPSDNIMSPATQKLNAFKSKQVNTMKSKSKPQSLFAKTTSRNADSAKEGAMFADIPKNS